MVRLLSVAVAMALMLLGGCGGPDIEPPVASTIGPGPAAEQLPNGLAAPLAELCERLRLSPTLRAVAVVFVLVDCPIANAYAAEYTRLHAQFAPQGIPLVLMHVDQDVSEEKIREHAGEFQIECPVMLDEQQTWVRLAGATKTPEAAVFDRQGNLLYRGRVDDQFAGVGKRRTKVTSQDLRAALEDILAERPVAVSRTEAVGCHILDLSGEE